MNKTVKTTPTNQFNKFQVQGRVKEVDGSILAPVNSGLKMIIAVCSQTGEYESPFYNMLIKRYSKVRDDYRSLFINQNIKLGTIHSTATNSETWVMQLVCLDKNNKLDKKSLEDCITKLLDSAKYEKASLHVSDLLFKDVPSIKKLLMSKSPEAGVNLYIYKTNS